MILFTSKTCVSCKVVKQHIESTGLPVEVADIFEDDRALAYPQIRSVPALVKDDDTLLMGSEQILDYLKTAGV